MFCCLLCCHAQLPAGRWWSGPMAVIGTSLYLIGGANDDGTIQSTVYLFDTTTTTWTSGLVMVRM